MIQRQLKLKLTVAQEATLNEWLWILTGVHNWAVRKIELDAKDGRYYSRYDIEGMLRNHSERLGVPQQVLVGCVRHAHQSWDRCFKKINGKPRLKGARNRLNSIFFKNPFLTPKNNRIGITRLGKVRFQKDALPTGKIKCGRIVKRASGWYLCLFIDAEPNAISITGDGQVGIDPGFKDLLTLSNGTKIEHPRELEASAKRLAQAQRGVNRKLVARLREHTANQRKDRNHKLSRTLVSENGAIYWSKDSHKAIARKFGKSVASSSHGQLKQMLSYKAQSCGRIFCEVESRNSTKRCSACQALSGPSGLRNLAVRFWECACGARHDRDVNAAVNALNVGRGLRHESKRELVSEIEDTRRSALNALTVATNEEQNT